MAKLKALYICHDHTKAYGPDEQADLAERLDILGPAMTAQAALEQPDLLERMQVMLSSWGAPHLDAAFLDRAPGLELVLYGAGAIGGFMTHLAWQRGVRITSAYMANSQPVAEYCLAAIIMGLKRAMPLAQQMRRSVGKPADLRVAGGYRSKVGLISLGAVGRCLCQRLKSLDVDVHVYDPFVDEQKIRELGAEPMGMEDIFTTCDVVSLHTPWLPETEKLVTGEMVASMKTNCVLINTARGAVLDEPAVVAVLQQRQDLFAFLDVTWPEPPVAGSPLYQLPNVLLTPHIAGSMGRECHRMGRYMVDELDRYLAGEPMQWELTPDNVAHTSHRPQR